MTHLSTSETENCKISINFPKSSEDHRIQLFEINGAVFAIVFAPLESTGPINLLCEKWSLILLAPIKSASSIKISADTIICLSDISSDEGSIDIHADGYFIKYSQSTGSNKELKTTAKKGVFNYSDDPGYLLFLYRQFEDVVLSIRSGTPESASKAQNNIITALCTLADKISDKKEDMTIRKAIEKWGIALL